MTYDNRAYWSSLHDAERGELTAVGYPALGIGFNRETYILRLRRAREILRDHAVAPKTVLEGAVGVGAYAPLWKELGVSRWVGVDIAETATADLRARHLDAEFFTIDLADASTAQLAGLRGPFDLATAIDVLYHLVSDRQFDNALQTLASCVSVGGHLLVSDVFTSVPRRTAAHVARRPIEAYERVLTPMGFKLVGRAPVFAVLGDPIPRAGVHPVDQVLSGAWRIAQKVIRSAPRRVRDGLGGYVVRMLAPVDSFLCRTGLTRGINLELGLFQRAASGRSAEGGELDGTLNANRGAP